MTIANIIDCATGESLLQELTGAALTAFQARQAELEATADADAAADQAEQDGRAAAIAALQNLLPDTYSLSDLANDVATLKQYYALASPTAAQTQGAFKVSLRVLGFVLRWLARNTPR